MKMIGNKVADGIALSQLFGQRTVRRTGDLPGQVEVDGKVLAPPVQFSPGPKTVILHDPAGEALLLPTGSYAGRLKPGEDNDLLFEGVYD